MKLHRFYLPDTDLAHSFWMNDERLFHQWTKVLRFEVGREVELFNDKLEDRLYRIEKIGNDAIHVVLVTEFEPRVPKTELYLCFAMLKKDKNEWVLQKGTELGVRHFVPLLTDRTEKTGWDTERARKIVIEAAEQCGRSDIPSLREPLTPERLLEELTTKAEVFIAEESSHTGPHPIEHMPVAVLIGPEGGWTDEEKRFFEERELKHVRLSSFTLRAETAAVTAAALLQ